MSKSTRLQVGSASSLTMEEFRMLSQLRDEFSRRGDFNRIFPTQDTWSQYGDLLESAYISSRTCAPSAATSLNRLVHENLFAASKVSGGGADFGPAFSKLPPKVPRKRPPPARSTRSAGVRQRIIATAAHRNWQSLNEDSDVEDAKMYTASWPSTSPYEQILARNVTIGGTFPKRIIQQMLFILISLCNSFCVF